MGQKMKTRTKKLVRNLNKKIISILVISLLLVISVVSVNAAHYQQQTAVHITVLVYADIYIDDDAAPGGDGSYDHPFQSIKDGLYASEDGDIVYVFDGTYYGFFFIEKEITLRGQSRENTKLDINIIDNLPTIGVMSSNVKIKGFSILSPVPKNQHTRGIDVICFGIIDDTGPYDNIQISDCNIYNQEFGIFLYNSTNVDIKNCNFYNNQHSINLHTFVWDFSNHDITIDNCKFYSNGKTTGPGVSYAGISMSFINELLNPRHSNITIKNCEFNDNIGPGIFACYCENVNIFKNSIENHSYFGGIALVNTKNVKIIANNIKNNHVFGILSSDSFTQNNWIYYNNFIDNQNNAYDKALNNKWCKSADSVGNYWSDYNGFDILPPYGIGDIPYFILGRTIPKVDWYPFMEPVDIEEIDEDELNTELLEQTLEMPQQTQSTMELSLPEFEITLNLLENPPNISINLAEIGSVTLIDSEQSGSASTMPAR